MSGQHNPSAEGGRDGDRRAVLVAAGEAEDLSAVRLALRAADLTIAVDGGLRHFRALGVSPKAWVGDGDSARPDDIVWAERSGTAMHWHPPAKDHTDLDLAVRLAQERGAIDVLIWGALGGRWDMTLANLLLAAHPRFVQAGLRIGLHDGSQELYLIHHATEIDGAAGDTVSLVPLGGDARGVTTEGLAYPLTDGTLLFGSTLGVSNALTGDHAHISVREGYVMCALIRQALQSARPAEEGVKHDDPP